MICFFVTEAHRYTLDEYLRAWARALGNHCIIASYESLPTRRSLSARTFIFTDLERLTPAQCDAAEQLARRIESAGARVLNRPNRVLRRFDLLRALHDAGRNPFNGYRVNGAAINCRFPVFVREENEHSGALTPLLKDGAELDAALAQLRAEPSRRAANLLVVEYCQTRGADALYRKYSAMRVADRLVPRHVLFSDQWVDKSPDVVTDAGLEEERAFLRAFPHAGDTRAAFELARIDYGRIDYSCVDGRVVTWEINTNPVIVPLPEKCDPRRLEGQANSSWQVSEALLALDGPDVRVSLAKLPPIGAVHRPLQWMALKSGARVWRAISRLPLAGRAVGALKRSLDLAAQRA
jgi:hypothetical protein